MEQTTEVPISTPSENPKVFDRTGEFTIPIRLAKKTITVRFPTDAELCRRQAMIRITLQRFGMEGTKTKVDGEERADLELIKSIKISGDDLDGAEANFVIERLLRAEADESQREGDHFVIPIVVTGGIRTTHTLREPTIAEIRKHDRATAEDTINGRRGAEFRISPARFGEFYDRLLKETNGYVGEVPVSHKVVVVRELVAAARQIETEDNPENFN